MSILFSSRVPTFSEHSPITDHITHNTQMPEEQLQQIEDRLKGLLGEVQKGKPIEYLAVEFSSLFHEATTVAEHIPTAFRGKGEALKSDIKACLRWTEAGFDPSLLVTDFQAVKFALTTQLAYAIQTYKNSSRSLEGPPMDIHNIGGKACVVQNGSLTPINALHITPVFRKEGHDFERFDGWTCTHPKGLVPFDTFRWERLQDHPIAQLNQQAIKAVFERAKAREDQPFVLQSIVTKTDIVSPIGLTKNLASMVWMHAHAIIIGRDGKVWSASTLMKKDEYDQIVDGVHTKVGMCGHAKINAPDYALTKKDCDHHVTYHPMTSEQAKKAFEYINEANNENDGHGIRFNMIRQNCVRFMTGLLAIVDQHPAVSESLCTTLYKALPHIEDFPVFGRALHKAIQSVQRVAQPMISLVSHAVSIVPPPVKRTVAHITQAIGNAVTFIPRKMLTFTLSLLLVKKFGGTEVSSEPVHLCDDTLNNCSKLTNFRTLYRSFWDLFDEDRLKVYHGYLLHEWMKTQPSYTCFDCRKSPRLPIDPRYSRYPRTLSSMYKG